MFGMAGLMGALTVGAVAPAGVVAMDEIESREHDQRHARSMQDAPASPPDPALGHPAMTAETDDWVSQGQSAQILDFKPAQDALVFVWDDSAPSSREPLVHIQEDPDATGQLQIWMGDRKLAQIAGPAALTQADLALIPLSAARELGFAPA